MRLYEIIRDSVIQYIWGAFGGGINYFLTSEFDFNRRRVCNEGRINNLYKSSGMKFKCMIKKQGEDQCG